MSASAQEASTPVSSFGRRRWKPFIKNEELSCYSYYLPHNDDAVATNTTDVIDENSSSSPTGFTTSQLDEWFRKLHPSNYDDEPPGSAWTDATYKNQLLLRKTAWHTFDDECTCEYGYSDTWQPFIKSQKMINVLKDITCAVSNVVGLDNNDGELLNSVNLNYYPRGGGVGWHADDEFLFDGLNRDTRIVSLSLCSPAVDNNDTYGARKFQVKRKGKKYESEEAHEIQLRHGDLMTMEGMFQKFYLHSVWPGDSKKYMDHELCRGERINLTWRTIVRHLDGSPECRGLMCPLSSKNDAS
ncbi:hypothetical protein ACHAXR_012476 [Thalassiosira sp. AJA248-18]